MLGIDFSSITREWTGDLLRGGEELWRFFLPCGVGCVSEVEGREDGGI